MPCPTVCRACPFLHVLFASALLPGRRGGSRLQREWADPERRASQHWQLCFDVAQLVACICQKNIIYSCGLPGGKVRALTTPVPSSIFTLPPSLSPIHCPGDADRTLETTPRGEGGQQQPPPWSPAPRVDAHGIGALFAADPIAAHSARAPAGPMLSVPPMISRLTQILKRQKYS
jgi:hypothetical protein